VQVLGLPTLSAPAYSSGQFQFVINGQSGATYVVLASTNLADWKPVATNSSAGATRNVSLAAPQGRSFYRAQLVQ